MSKKLISMVLIVSIVLSIFSVVTFAENNNLESKISKDEATKIALLFVSNTMIDEENIQWTKDTQLDSINETYDLSGNVNSFCFTLKKDNVPNGYVIISADSDLGTILEYSDSAEPIFSQFDREFDKIIYTAPLEYYLSKKNEIYEVSKDKKIKTSKKINKKELKDKFNRNRSDKSENRALINKLKKDFKENAENLWLLGANHTGQVEGYAVNSNVYDYVNSRYGKGWSIKSTKTVKSSGSALLMNNFRPGVGCCTITSLTYVFDYHRRNSSKSKIPSNINTLFNDIEAIAVNHGYNKKTGGTNPLKINNIINDTWKKYGYSGTGQSLYVFSKSDFTKEVDNNRPALLNISFGYYGNHTVSLVGYRIYSKGSSERLFLQVYDNWTTSQRFIDYEAITNPLSGDFSTLSISKVKP